MELRKYIECTKEEKRPLLKTINEIIDLANITRREGLIVLEQKMKESDDNFMKTGLELVLEATDPKFVKAIMKTLMITSFKTGAKLLKQLIITEGVLLVQAGTNPRIIGEQLLAYLGGDFTRQDLTNYEETEEEYKRLMQESDSWTPLEGLPEFENFLELSDHDIRLVMREIDIYDLCIALMGASKELKNHFLGNLTRRLCAVILKRMRLFVLGKSTKKEIQKAQQKILDILEILQESGEIQ